MFTVCPKCALTLVVTAADLRIAQGYVRCGRCSSVFNALARLSERQGRGGRRGGAGRSSHARTRRHPRRQGRPHRRCLPARTGGVLACRGAAVAAGRERHSRRGARVQCRNHGCELGIRGGAPEPAVDRSDRLVPRAREPARSAVPGPGLAGGRGDRCGIPGLHAARRDPRAGCAGGGPDRPASAARAATLAKSAVPIPLDAARRARILKDAQCHGRGGRIGPACRTGKRPAAPADGGRSDPGSRSTGGR